MEVRTVKAMLEDEIKMKFHTQTTWNSG